jgi:hypothetical protein
MTTTRVEIVTQQKRHTNLIHRQQSTQFTMPLLVFRLSRVVIALLLVIMVSIRVLQWLIEPTASATPFTPYELILPGQPIQVLSAFACHYEFSTEIWTPNVKRCIIYPESGYFSVIVLILHEQIIQEGYFTSDTLRLGDIYLRWGLPDRLRETPYPHWFTVIWKENDISVKVNTKSLRYFEPIHFVIITTGMEAGIAED